MSLTALLSTTLALMLLLCSTMVDGRPSRLKNRHAVKSEHIIRKRATLEDILGDLSATAPGILNEDRVPLGNCKEIYDAGQKTSGLYHINPAGDAKQFTVFCDMNPNLRGGGWTVISRRVNDSTSFNRNWGDYRNGFGEFNANFWLGLQKIKDITDYKSATYELYIGLHSFHPTDTVNFAHYDSFSLGDEASRYSLNIGAFDSTSTAGNALVGHKGQKFSTPDEDNDNSATNCALDNCAGWWYRSCLDSHLTGKWYAGGLLPDIRVPDGIIWDTWRGEDESLQSVVMAVRPV